MTKAIRELAGAQPFLCAGARLGDALTLGPEHVRDGWLEWQPRKAGSAPASIPTLPPLAEAIEAFRPPVQALRGPFLVTAYGHPHASEKAPANWFKRRCTEASVEKSAHGIRKALGGLLADLGCSEHEIMAVLGHANPRTSAIYTASAKRKQLAASAAEKLRGWKWRVSHGSFAWGTFHHKYLSLPPVHVGMVGPEGFEPPTKPL